MFYKDTIDELSKRQDYLQTKLTELFNNKDKYLKDNLRATMNQSAYQLADSLSARMDKLEQFHDNILTTIGDNQDNTINMAKAISDRVDYTQQETEDAFIKVNTDMADYKKELAELKTKVNTVSVKDNRGIKNKGKSNNVITMDVNKQLIDGKQYHTLRITDANGIVVSEIRETPEGLSITGKNIVVNNGRVA